MVKFLSRCGAVVLLIVSSLGCSDGGGGSDGLDSPPESTFGERGNAGTITDFLWKPKADAHSRSPGTLAVLVSACNGDVRVNGLSLIPSGPSNGRCTTSRGADPGCSYGQNVKVEVFDPLTGLPYLFPTGDPFYLVTNGCNREEYKL